jgi:hypothetical protein
LLKVPRFRTVVLIFFAIAESSDSSSPDALINVIADCCLLNASFEMISLRVIPGKRQSICHRSSLIVIVMNLMLMLMLMLILHSLNYHANIHKLLNVFMFNPSRFWHGSIPTSDSNRCSSAHWSSFARAMMIDRDNHDVTRSLSIGNTWTTGDIRSLQNKALAIVIRSKII